MPHNNPKPINPEPQPKITSSEGASRIKAVEKAVRARYSSDVEEYLRNGGTVKCLDNEGNVIDSHT